MVASPQVDDMDITISLMGDRLETNLFEKKMALYLYLPLRSSHSPGMGS